MKNRSLPFFVLLTMPFVFAPSMAKQSTPSDNQRRKEDVKHKEEAVFTSFIDNLDEDLIEALQKELDQKENGWYPWLRLKAAGVVLSLLEAYDRWSIRTKNWMTEVKLRVFKLRAMLKQALTRKKAQETTRA
ncbi:MAG: hypothetical protein WBQ73_01515 [Candidatus Babeliales bacterium]